MFMVLWYCGLIVLSTGKTSYLAISFIHTGFQLRCTGLICYTSSMKNERSGGFKPVVTKKIYQEILEQFVEMIIAGKLVTGQKLPSERELVEIFNVSRPSIREALRVLEIIGLVEIQSGGGAYLTELNIAPFINLISPLLFHKKDFHLELFDLRELIERRALDLLGGRIEDAYLVQFGEIIERMREALATDDPEMGAEADIAFHKTLVLASGSYILQKTLDLVVTLLEHSIRGSRTLVLQNEEDAVQLYEDHQAIYLALKAEKMAEAARLVKAHLEMVRRLYRDRSGEDE
jgi:GntR family transcriptional regulator, transcriptional repressor for pyruvate dehydrogenase complex